MRRINLSALFSSSQQKKTVRIQTHGIDMKKKMERERENEKLQMFVEISFFEMWTPFPVCVAVHNGAIIDFSTC